MSNIYVGDAAEGVIGLPQRFCEAKDLWEKEEQASKPCPDEGGAARFALLRRGDSCIFGCAVEAEEEGLLALLRRGDPCISDWDICLL